jgi:hypothetical protein
MTNTRFHAHNTFALIAAAFAFLTLTGCTSGTSAEGTFDKAYTVNGPAHLQVSTGSGDTTITVGAPGEVRIHGSVSVHSFSSESGQRRINEITGNPPVSQQDNLIRVSESGSGMNNVSIDYTITVPPDTELRANSGSGDLNVSNIKGPANITVGSGAVNASNIGSDVQLRVGSGDAEIANVGGQITGGAGSGNVKFSTVKGVIRFEAGSGDIEIANPGNSIELNTGSGDVTITSATADVRAHTSSGDVEIQGDPGASNYWDIHTSSGDVTLNVPGSASFRLHARTGSGDIEADLPISMEGTTDKHELRARLGDGKARVEVETSSGGITLK